MFVCLFVYNLFNRAVGKLDYISSTDLMKMGWKGCGWKRAWSNLRCTYYPDILLYGVRKPPKPGLNILDMPAETRTVHLSGTVLSDCSLSQRKL
jgi:hypothetical protein